MASTKCVILARVSSRAQEEEGYSLDAQEQYLNEYAAKHQFVAAKLFKIAETASKDKERLIFKEMMQFMTKNSIKVLLVEKADRLTRSFKDMVMIDDWLAVDDSRTVHLLKDSLILKKNSRSQDKLNWGLKVLVAKNFTDNLREEVYKGRQEKLAQGWLPGKPPYGYITTGDKGKKIHIPDQDRARLVVMLFKKYLEPDQSLSSVMQYAKEIGVRTSKDRPMSRSALTDNVLQNVFYIGTNRWQGIDYPGNQEPIIDKDLFNAVQTKMHKKASAAPKYRKHDPDLRSIVQCLSCGGTITWEFQKGTWYGHCNRYKGCPPKKYARQERIEEQFFKHFEGLLCPSKEIAQWIIDSLKAKHQNDIYDHAASVDVLQQDCQRKKRQLDLLYEDRLSERISPERYDEHSARLMAEQKEIEHNIVALSETSRKRLMSGIDVLERSQQAAAIYSTKTASEKRTLLCELFSDIKLDGDVLHVIYNPFTAAISKHVKKHREVEMNFRTNKNTPDNEGESELTEALRTVWRARPDLNRRSPP